MIHDSEFVTEDEAPTERFLHVRLKQIRMSVKVTTDVSMAVRTWWVGTGVAVRKATCSTTSGTSAWVSLTVAPANEMTA